MLQSMEVNIEIPDDKLTMLDYEIKVEEKKMNSMEKQIANADIEQSKIKGPTVVINAIDPIRHEEVIREYLADNLNVILLHMPPSPWRLW